MPAHGRDGSGELSYDHTKLQSRMKPQHFAAVLLLFCSAARGGESPIVATGAKLEKLAGGFEFTEGPAPDNKGNVYFTDQPNDRIMKWSADGKLSTFLK